MYKTLLKKIKRKTINVAIAFLVLIIVISGLFFYLNGISYLFPKEVKYQNFEENLGKAVKVDTELIEDFYMEVIKNKRKGVSKKETVSARGYIAYDYENDKYYGLVLGKRFIKKIDAEIENYFNDETGEYVQDLPKFYGVVKKMEDEDKQYFDESMEYILASSSAFYFLEEMGLDSSDLSDEESDQILDNFVSVVREQGIIKDYTEYYYIDSHEGFESLITIIVIIVIVILLIISIFSFIKKYKKASKFQKIKDKIEQNPEITEEILNEEFNNSSNFGEIWIGNKYIFFFEVAEATFEINDDILWAYVSMKKVRTRNGKMKYYYLNLLNKNGEIKSIETDKFRYKNIIEKLAKDFSYIYIGYNKELEMLVQEDINNINNFDKNLLDIFNIKEE